MMASLLLAIAPALFARPGKTKHNLYLQLKSVASSDQLNWKDEDNYRTASFDLSGKSVSIFEDKDNQQLIGFDIPYDLNKIPSSITQAVAKKYPGSSITDAVHYIDEKGNEYDYAMIKQKKENLVFRIKKGKATYFGKSTDVSDIHSGFPN